ncbi:MAG: 16S rRNA (cytosine(1402)-N(4))-methyltransferase RsmH [Thiovulaceae bacterium]|nr:16S rRNA (cytosine(1402)-N(4))-methyltransferase RsmH [Sulfurimonadaceae bacterium]
MSEIPHIPVLLSQTLESFATIKEGTIIDCTLGYGGHSEALLKRYPQINIIGIDRDQTAIDFATKRLASFGDRFQTIKGDFASSFKKALVLVGVDKVKGVLADIGVSSLQLDQADRGFGFQSEVLDMRMDQNASKSAYEVVNEYSHEKLMKIFYEYGEIPYGKDLAQKIIDKRSIAPICSAKELSELAMSFRGNKKIHPATLMFQAIRIEVNDELGQLESVLDSIENSNLQECIVSIITFHSLEDRIVKQRFKSWTQSCICPHDAMRCTCGNDHEKGKMLNKKPLSADDKELKDNPRSRSAKLRSFLFGTKSAF